MEVVVLRMGCERENTRRTRGSQVRQEKGELGQADRAVFESWFAASWTTLLHRLVHGR